MTSVSLSKQLHPPAILRCMYLAVSCPSLPYFPPVSLQWRKIATASSIGNERPCWNSPPRESSSTQRSSLQSECSNILFVLTLSIIPQLIAGPPSLLVDIIIIYEADASCDGGRWCTVAVLFGRGGPQRPLMQRQRQWLDWWQAMAARPSPSGLSWWRRRQLMAKKVAEVCDIGS